MQDDPSGLDDLARRLLPHLAGGAAASRLRRTTDITDPRALVRALLTVRDPGPFEPEVVRLLDSWLSGERAARGVVNGAALPSIAEDHPGTGYPAAASTVLWEGDITTLAVDAIVNAANPGLLGCFQPSHRCVDNVIHAAAGPRLRADCHAIVAAQGHPEPAGRAQITPGHHLPARYVLHTVGPAVTGPVTAAHEATLVSSYRRCLDLAKSHGLRSVAFCSISTGLYGYPRAAAARLALATVADWLATHPGGVDRVVFDVFGADDLNLFRRLIGG
ncbi:protein-ADP-ribose hydrolase [Actinoplanes philippinensis]|uniref:protein-ADP-ribose hydrolase n=1 Tax=Actinoplanes philippinensis TaxID=35752 RepID=UPI00340F2276